MKITVEKTINGILVLSAMVNGHLVRRKYIGYTRKEAWSMFRDEVGGK
jgi:hypothetical protein